MTDVDQFSNSNTGLGWEEASESPIADSTSSVTTDVSYQISSSYDIYLIEIKFIPNSDSGSYGYNRLESFQINSLTSGYFFVNSGGAETTGSSSWGYPAKSEDSVNDALKTRMIINCENQVASLKNMDKTGAGSGITEAGQNPNISVSELNQISFTVRDPADIEIRVWGRNT